MCIAPSLLGRFALIQVSLDELGDFLSGLLGSQIVRLSVSLGVVHSRQLLSHSGE